MTPAEFGASDRTAIDAKQTGIDAKSAEPGTDRAVSGRDPTGPDAELPEIEADWPAGLPRPRHEEALPGGYVGRTSRAVLADGRTVLIKRCPYPAAQEADGLRALAAAGAPAPGVLGVGGRTLVLEWLQGEPDWPALGRAVAGMHRHTADRFGWPADNYAGRFPQDNTWTDDWPTFYVRHPGPAAAEPCRKKSHRSYATGSSTPVPAHSRRYCGQITPPRSPTGTCGRAT